MILVEVMEPKVVEAEVVETIVAVEMMIAIIAATVKNIPAEEVGEW
jgi:hypothetical protein